MTSFRLLILLAVALISLLCQSANMPRLASEKLYLTSAVGSYSKAGEYGDSANFYTIDENETNSIEERVDIRDLAEELFGPTYLENSQFYPEDDNDFHPRESFIESFLMKAFDKSDEKRMAR